MVDLLTAIELEFKKVMLDIKKTTTTAGGYTYFNTVTVVNIDDECVAKDRGDFPTISIYLDPNENILSGDQQAFENETFFKLVCSVALDEPVGTPRFAINKKMNEMLSDLKAVLSGNTSLNCSCDLVSPLTSNRVYNNDGDMFRAGDLIVRARVNYTQSRNNPLLQCNV